MVTSETKVLQLEFIDAGGKKMTISLEDPKDGLKQGDVDTAASTVIAQNVFAKDGNDLTALKTARIVSKTIETLDA